MSPIPYRADQVGSLLRPPRLLEARSAQAQGRITRDDLRKVEDEAILEGLEMQRAAGGQVFTDGEYRRRSWQTAVAEAVEGFVTDALPIDWRGPRQGSEEPSSLQVVGGKLRQTRRVTAHESAFLEEHAPGPFKITIPSPSVFMLGAYKPGLTERYYPTRQDLVHELIPIVRRELQALIDEGVPYVQLDAPQYTYYVDPRLRVDMVRDGIDPDQAVADAVAADNACIEGLHREGVVIALHACRGNRRSMWVAEGGYDTIAEQLFAHLQVDRFLLEYDTDRAGGFEPLRFVPPGKTVVLGLVTTKEPRFETQDELLRRIDEASHYVPMENLALSPQCGFASNSAGNLISFDDQRRKIELVVETARRVWG